MERMPMVSKTTKCWTLGDFGWKVKMVNYLTNLISLSPQAINEISDSFGPAFELTSFMGPLLKISLYSIIKLP